MNSQIKVSEEIKCLFQSFLKKNVNEKYSSRWENLFNKGVKGWQKMDIWDAWKDNFFKVNIIKWEKDFKRLLLFLKGKNVDEFIFLGLGHNKPKIIEQAKFKEIEKIFKENIEGIIFANNTTVIMNHDGEFIVIDN